MARIVDITPTFDDFARLAALESPIVRERLWRERYQSAHQEIFDGFYAGYGTPEGMHALVRELSRVRSRVEEAAPAVAKLVEEVEPAVRSTLGANEVPEPLHVLMVGTLTTNAFVGRVGDDVAVFHCLEWFQAPEPTRVLIAHEDTHAWHELILGEVPTDDPAWTAFYEGVAIHTSRAVVPNRPPDDYFWYGHPGFEEWLPWCNEHRDVLLERFGEFLEMEGANETFFGGGSVDGHWRVGFYIADVLVEAIDRPLEELVRMSVDEGRAAIREALP